MCVNVVRSLLLMIMQDIWILKKHIEPGQGLLTLTWVSEHLETLTLEAKEQVRFLKCIPDSLLLS